MIIRKLYKFENSHIVRNCSTDRCKTSIHGHSYKIEVLLESEVLDHGQMVLDFGLMKGWIKELIDSFDHAAALWEGDDPAYLEAMKTHSKRWVQLPVSPSAEQFARVIFFMVALALKRMALANGEEGVKVHSVIVHETDTGYAQAFLHDVVNERMGEIHPERILFSDGVREEWSQKDLWEMLLEE